VIVNASDFGIHREIHSWLRVPPWGWSKGLARPVYAAQETAQVPGQCDRQTVGLQSGRSSRFVVKFLSRELPAGKVSGDLADSVASRGRCALLFLQGKYDSRGRYRYRICPNRGLNGAEKILIPDMLEVKLCVRGLSAIKDRWD
jgi:hypothetical protein